MRAAPPLSLGAAAAATDAAGPLRALEARALLDLCPPSWSPDAIDSGVGEAIAFALHRKHAHAGHATPSYLRSPAYPSNSLSFGVLSWGEGSLAHRDGAINEAKWHEAVAAWLELGLDLVFCSEAQSNVHKTQDTTISTTISTTQRQEQPPHQPQIAI